MTDWVQNIFDTEPVIRIGISGCLLGERIRYDGDHAHDSLVTTTFSPFVEWVSVCPEMEIGMGTPREPIRLVQTGDTVRLLGIESGTDYTGKMRLYAVERINLLAQSNLHGYILKRNSPSCGLEQVRVFNQNGVPIKTGAGMFAGQLMRQLPLLPVEEETGLQEPARLQNFVERIFAYYRLQRFLAADPSPGALVEFHTRHKLTLMSHHQERYREAGRLVAEMTPANQEILLPEYTRHFMKTLEVRVSRKNHTNVLNHTIGYFKDFLETDDKLELVGIIDRYRKGLVPLAVPLTLINHHLRRYPVEWLEKQVYLNPYPAEQKLRYML